MKQNICLCLDVELIRLLEQTGNKSGTTNEVLKNFFNLRKDPKKLKDEYQLESQRLMEEAQKIEKAIQEQERIRLEAIEKAELMAAEEKERLRQRIEAERNTPERIARREELRKWALNPANKAKIEPIKEGA